MAAASGAGSGAARVVAALTALGLGLLAAVMMVAGHAPWEGPQVMTLTQTHGIHKGDAFALIPVVIGTALALWCLQEPQRHRGG